ncbi:hypothetical protein BDA99DRAFT_507252, partial [Phascolomyces articulosus]
MVFFFFSFLQMTWPLIQARSNNSILLNLFKGNHDSSNGQDHCFFFSIWWSVCKLVLLISHAFHCLILASSPSNKKAHALVVDLLKM